MMDFQVPQQTTKLIAARRLERDFNVKFWFSQRAALALVKFAFSSKLFYNIYRK
jgi:hypothetical protein